MLGKNRQQNQLSVCSSHVRLRRHARTLVTLHCKMNKHNPVSIVFPFPFPLHFFFHYLFTFILPTLSSYIFCLSYLPLPPIISTYLFPLSHTPLNPRPNFSSVPFPSFCHHVNFPSFCFLFLHPSLCYSSSSVGCGR